MRPWSVAGAILLGSLSGCARDAGRGPERAWQVEAEGLEQRGRPAQALSVLARAVEAGERPAADVAAVGLLARHREIGRALQRARLAAEAYPDRAEVLEAHYHAAAANRLFDEAREVASRLLPLRSRDPVLLRHLGVLEIHGRAVDRAVDLLELSCDLDPRSFASWYALGRAREMLDAEPEAIEAYRRALALLPGATAARWRLARLLSRRSPARAREILGDVDPGNLPAEGLYLLATLEMRLGRTQSGEDLLERHRRLRADLERGEHDGVREAAKLEEAVDLLAAGKTAQAEEALVEAQRAGRARREADREVVRAEILRARGDDWRALEALTRAVDQRPRNWRLRYLVAEQLLRGGLAAQALVQLDRAATLQPLALEARELRLRLLRELRPGETAAESEVVDALRMFALPSQREAERDERGCLVGAARRELLFDLVQLGHPTPGSGEDPIPMDDPLPSAARP